VISLAEEQAKAAWVLHAGNPASGGAVLANMLCAVTDANGGISSYSYDGGNRLLTLSDQLKHT